MIVVDTSALMAIVLGEEEADACIEVLATNAEVRISAANVAEALIVATRRSIGPEMTRLIDDFGFEVVPVTEGSARRVADVYATWGRGVHPAGLNLGDCFAYELASHSSWPVLFVGEDFGMTDFLCAG